MFEEKIPISKGSFNAPLYRNYTTLCNYEGVHNGRKYQEKVSVSGTPGKNCQLVLFLLSLCEFNFCKEKTVETITDEVLSQFYSARNWKYVSEYDKMVLNQVFERGGFYNAHAHLDRAYTLDDIYLRHIGRTSIEASNDPLLVKQNLVGDLHTGVAYTEENLRARMSYAIEVQMALGTTRLDTCIDATPDLPEDGLLAIRIALELKEKYKDQIKIRIAPNPIFGFKEGTGRFTVFKAAAKLADFLSLLPEKDGNEHDPKFRQHIRKGMEIACELGKEVQLHLDQANLPNEEGTLTLLEGLRWIDKPKIEGHAGPTIKIIHMISPTAYSEDRFAKLIDQLLEHNAGVIICPTAAISMRQLRSLEAPLHNSIARMLELIKRKVPLWLGTDNICDVFVPQGDGDLLTELKMGGHAIRIAMPSIWSKLSTGTPFNDVDITTVGRALHEDRKAYLKVAPFGWTPAVE
ncbi:MAG: hypothetical protein WCT49_03445 [Candidatus Paceibacterota bacterium]|nr:hypothetical protein [Candidatus Paceibacterota bacterium]